MKLWVLNNPLSYVVACICLLLSYSCEEAGGIGEEIGVNIETGVVFTDTLTVKTSTVLSENITSDAFRLLTGQYKDPIFGTVQAKTFFELLPSATLELINKGDYEPIYDSLRLVLPYQYSYADTTALQRFSLHRITEANGIDTSTIYTNFSSVAYESTPLTSFEIKASTIQAQAAMLIELPDELGQEVFNYSLAKNTVSDFRSKFKGLAMVPDTSFNDNASIIGFKAVRSSFFDPDFNTLRMILYYTEKQKREGQTDTLINRVVNFFVANGARFNQITADRSNTPLAALQTPLTDIPSSETNNLTYLQGGTGVLTRIEFPTLKDLSKQGNVAINRAELLVKSKTGTSLEQTYPFPNSLLFQEVISGNQIRTYENGSPVFVISGFSQGQPIFLSLSYNDRYEDYSGSFTGYLNQLLSGSNDTAALIVTPSNNSEIVDRVILNNSPQSGFKFQLRVFYTVFN